MSSTITTGGLYVSFFFFSVDPVIMHDLLKYIHILYILFNLLQMTLTKYEDATTKKKGIELVER